MELIAEGILGMRSDKLILTYLFKKKYGIIVPSCLAMGKSGSKKDDLTGRGTRSLQVKGT